MLKRLVRLFFILICGYLVIEWISVEQPFVLSEFVIGLIVEPLQFFLAVLALFLGMLANAGTLRELVHNLKKGQTGQKLNQVSFFGDFILLILIYSLLFSLGWEQTLVFLGLNMIYGMISVLF
jgi:hypothetical protein